MEIEGFKYRGRFLQSEILLSFEYRGFFSALGIVIFKSNREESVDDEICMFSIGCWRWYWRQRRKEVCESRIAFGALSPH